MKKQQPLSFSALFPKSMSQAVKELLFIHLKGKLLMQPVLCLDSTGRRVLLPISQGHGGEQAPSQAPWQGGQGGRLAREPGNREPRAGKRKQENDQDRQSGGGWMRIQSHSQNAKLNAIFNRAAQLDAAGEIKC